MAGLRSTRRRDSAGAGKNEGRRERIITAAAEEFIRAGVDNAKISDIAVRARVGPATVYRHFKNKAGLAIACAVRVWGGEWAAMMADIGESSRTLVSPGGQNGFERTGRLLRLFYELYDKHPALLRLLEQFDCYLVKEQVPAGQLAQYDACILDTRADMLRAIEAGKRDGSIRPDLDSLLFYTAVTHALTALSQKLLLRGSILQSDLEVDGKKQLTMLIDMALDSIRPRKG